VPADGYLGRVLADGALPFRYRGSIRALLGEPDGPGLLRATPPAPQAQLSYPRPAWTGEVERPDGILTMAEGPWDWPAGNDHPGGDGSRGAALGGMRHGVPDEIPEPTASHPPAAAPRTATAERPAAAAERGPQPGAAASPRAVTEVSSATVPGPAHAAPPLITEPPSHVTAGPAQIPAAGPAYPPRPQAGPTAAAGPGPPRSAAAPARRESQPAAPAGGPRELLIPGKTVRSSPMTGSEETSAGPGPSGPAGPVNQGRPDGPSRRSGGAPAEITGHEQARTFGSDESNRPDPSPAVRRIPPGRPGVSAREHGGDPVIPDRHGSPVRGQRPAGPGRQADIGPVREAETPPTRRPRPEASISGQAEQPPAAAPVPPLIVTLPPRTPRSRTPPAFWERRHLGRLWSRPLR
jgi:hypothetical protein